MHSDAYKSIWFKRDSVTDAIVLYILILISLILTLIEDHRSAREQERLHQLSHQVFQSIWMEFD